jgi:hypothetical protein
MRVRIKRTYKVAPAARGLESRFGHVPPNACWASDASKGLWVDYAEWAERYFYRKRRLPWTSMQYQLFA